MIGFADHDGAHGLHKTAACTTRDVIIARDMHRGIASADAKVAKVSASPSLSQNRRRG